MELLIENEAYLDKVIEVFLPLTKSCNVVFLNGDLGAGKTTFVKQLIKYLEGKDQASSPTYSLVNEYETNKGTVYHLDLYRLDDTNEAQDMGIEEYLDSKSLCLVEWPRIIEHLVDQAIVIHIETHENGVRKFKIGMLIP